MDEIDRENEELRQLCQSPTETPVNLDISRQIDYRIPTSPSSNSSTSGGFLELPPIAAHSCVLSRTLKIQLENQEKKIESAMDLMKLMLANVPPAKRTMLILKRDLWTQNKGRSKIVTS